MRIPTWRRISQGLNFRIGYIAGGRFGAFCRPRTPMFLLTERCNARCVHCDIWKNKGSEESPGLAGWSEVLKDLRSWLGPITIVFTGGEALLRPYTLELVNHATSLGFELEILTHGYWDDQTKIEEIARADPWRITISMDGIGAIHSQIRGREDFFERTNRTVETLVRMKEQQHGLRYQILLKTVIMEHNLDNVCEVAEYATRSGVEVFYQPIEQNYNTLEDPEWFKASANWPQDPERAVRVVEELIRLKRQGRHIANTERQLEVMIPYFRDPAGHRVTTQGHVAHLRRPLCSAMTGLQFQSNGDVTVCCNRPPIGNIKEMPIRQIWAQRPRYWETGCCLNVQPGERASQRSPAVLPEITRSAKP